MRESANLVHTANTYDILFPFLYLGFVDVVVYVGTRFNRVFIKTVSIDSYISWHCFRNSQNSEVRTDMYLVR